MDKIQIRERLLEGQTKKFWVVTHRPSTEISDGKLYAWTNTMFENENKKWRFINRLLNGKWDYQIFEFELPAKYLSPNIYPIH